MSCLKLEKFCLNSICLYSKNISNLIISFYLLPKIIKPSVTRNHFMCSFTISVASNCYVAHDVRNIMSSIDGVDILICTAREARLQLKRVSPLLFKRKIPLRWNFFVTNLIHFLNILKKRNNLRLHHHMFRQSFLCTKGLLCYEVYLCNPKVF